MVHGRTGLLGVRGTLALELEASRLVFRPEGGRSANLVLPLKDLAGVRRARGSPVLEVRPVGSSTAPRVVGFYFVKPPPLEPPPDSFPIFAKYMAKRRSIQALRAGNAVKGREVDEWVAKLREAVFGGSG
jgi:hypothetical protein